MKILDFRGSFSVLLFCVFVRKSHLLDNGLALTPPMGWMSWGYYMCGVDCLEKPEKCLDEKVILGVADAFVNEGYRDAGYEYIIIDDCWSERQRNILGELVPSKERFPRGMKYIADYIHARGLKFGMYTNVAEITCMGFPGSKGHFQQDANTFAKWGVDYLKVDGCFEKEAFLNRAYIQLGRALNNTGRPMVYSCSWPYYIEFIHKKPPELSRVAHHCNLWRNYHDVALSYDNVDYIIKYFTRNSQLSAYHGPGHWNDPDMLIIGTNTLTPGQSRLQIAVFAMLSAPLLISCDMNKVTEEDKKLLQNLELLAVAQDPLGIMAIPLEFEEGITLWVKKKLPIKGNTYHSYSFAITNFNKHEKNIFFTPGKHGLESDDGYSVMDVFAETFVRNISKETKLSVTVKPTDVVLYTVYPL